MPGVPAERGFPTLVLVVYVPVPCIRTHTGTLHLHNHRSGIEPPRDSLKSGIRPKNRRNERSEREREENKWCLSKCSGKSAMANTYSIFKISKVILKLERQKLITDWLEMMTSTRITEV
jgi:hypothetical protein